MGGIQSTECQRGENKGILTMRPDKLANDVAEYLFEIMLLLECIPVSADHNIFNICITQVTQLPLYPEKEQEAIDEQSGLWGCIR